MKMRHVKLRGRPPARQRRVLDDLHGQIISGILRPAMRLPSRRELADHYGVSPVTVQQAMSELARDGFVEARGTHGTFVADRPPHLSNYALVFYHPPGHRAFPRYWTALAQEAHAFDRPDRQLSVWYGVDQHADNEDFQRLCSNLERHRLAGLIFPTTPTEYLHTPLLDHPGIARVAVMRPNPGYANIAHVELNYESFLSRALENLRSRGRRRIAVLLPEGLIEPNDTWMERMARFGLETRPYWVQGARASSPGLTRNLVHLLVRRGQDPCPDGLLIGDDNLLEHATAGLMDAGVRVPEELDVVSHCNFPWPTPSLVPVRRIGFDSREVLATCIESLEQQRQGLPPINRQVLARFEEEVASPGGG